MQKLFLLLTMTLLLGSVQAQKHFTREGKITFTSDAPLEKIEAVNNTATAVLDTESNRMEFAVLIKGFQFEKALMQEHFNENYMESSTYPKATFKGLIEDADNVKWTVDGTYNVTVSGNMTIHGATQKLTAPGTITIKNGAIGAQSTFQIAVADYKIEIPSVVAENIAKEVAVSVDIALQPLNK
jgi:polyisoprenoid-binding protein YceI